MKFERLLEPGYIGQVRTRNRMVKTGATLLYWHENELQMNERIKAFYEALARGGVGLLVVEAPTIDYPFGRRWEQRYRIDDDKYIKGLSELVQIIHKHGCPTFMQMNHDGPWQTVWGPEPLVPGPPIAASPVSIDSPNDFHNEVPRALTIPEIEEIVDKFASAAVRAEKAGFDGVDINAASSHLLHNFLSPFWNKRQDAYGCGSLENRARFLVEIIQEIKKRLGQDFPVSIIINGIEIGQAIGVDNSECLTAEDSRGIAQLLEQAGADAIQVRSHWLGIHMASFLTNALFYPEPPVPLEFFPEEYDWSRWGAGANIPTAAAMRKVLSIPVAVVGRLDPVLGERVLREGKADFIAMTRRLQADPELPNKVALGRLEDIAPCTACDSCLSARGVRGCRINAALGTDKPYAIKHVGKRKRVVVVGGGPAGMEAARVAASRGHEVILYEKTKKLGGLLPMAAVIKGLKIEDLPAIVKYLKGQITRLGVRIRLGKEVSPALIEAIGPDVVILATGGVPATPDIAGIKRRKVVSTAKLHRRLRTYSRLLGPKLLRRLTKLYMPVGRRVIVIGGSIQGCELAEFLVKRGRKVTIVDTAEALGEGMIMHLRAYLLDWFDKKGVTMLTSVTYEEITKRGLTIITREEERKTIEADSIIPALPLVPDTSLLKSLEGKVPELYTVGDCKEAGLIIDAIADGFHTARAI